MGTFLTIFMSVVDFLAALKHKHVWPCLIKTLKQMFYDYSTNGKKTWKLKSASITAFMGVLLTQWYTVQLGNEGISQDSSINESHNLNAEFSI